MIIDERIFQLLVPGVLSALYPMQAPDRAAAPYTTYFLMNDRNLTTHDTVLPQTRMWMLQLSTWSPSYMQSRTASNSIQDALVGYSDSSISGITYHKEHGAWDDIAKFYGWTLELLITEQL